jgi:hypothetical protein
MRTLYAFFVTLLSLSAIYIVFAKESSNKQSSSKQGAGNKPTKADPGP